MGSESSSESTARSIWSSCYKEDGILNLKRAELPLLLSVDQKWHGDEEVDLEKVSFPIDLCDHPYIPCSWSLCLTQVTASVNENRENKRCSNVWLNIYHVNHKIESMHLRLMNTSDSHGHIWASDVLIRSTPTSSSSLLLATSISPAGWMKTTMSWFLAVVLVCHVHLLPRIRSKV